MKVQIGEIFMDKAKNLPVTLNNKTKKYLLPCLKQYGKEFTTKISNVFKSCSWNW